MTIGTSWSRGTAAGTGTCSVERGTCTSCSASDARLLLSTPLHAEAKLHHELASRLAFVSNPGIVRAVAWLYWDDSKGALRRGATSRQTPGSVYRFIDVVQQLEVNFDLYGMSEKAIVDLLPPAFDRWRSMRQGLLSRLAGWGRTAVGRTARTEAVGREP